MPTGYTSDIYDGKDVSLSEYILKCSRAFGAMIHMRDESLDAPIKKPEPPSHHYEESLDSLKKELKQAKSMTIFDAKKEIEDMCRSREESNKKYYTKKMALKKRYESILGQVEDWTPPTDSHKELKEFAIKQLKDSISFDCGNLEDYLEPVETISPEEWIENRINAIENRIAYNTRRHEEEEQRYSDRIQWIDDLLDSLK